MTSPSLAQIRQRLAEGVPTGRADEDGVRRQWWAALATLQNDFLLALQPLRGVWLASPLPALYEPALLRQLQGWVWTTAAVGSLLQPPLALLPDPRSTDPPPAEGEAAAFERLTLREDDGTDPLLLLITPDLQVAMALEGEPQRRRFVLRFDPATLSAALQLVDLRLQDTAPQAGLQLRSALQRLGQLRSDEDMALRFWPRLGEQLAAMAPSVTLQPLVRPGASNDHHAELSSELALLEALTHEVRTPLATIRTLIRSLLRRRDLPAVVEQRLQQIDSECSEQIDRFGLIFHAAELQRQPRQQQQLARTDLAALLHQLAGLWQRQLERRNLTLRLEVAEAMPPVLSDPSRLETMLGGLIDRFSRSLPSGTTVWVRLQPAGSRLKLQLSSDEPGGGRDPDGGKSWGRGSTATVGPVLRWDPLTGSLQLSRQATQDLFRSLGGRLTERSGSGLTVFFPLANQAPATPSPREPA